ncbi:MAG: diacylglyceryl transferase [Bacteroidetes bacterium]|nr:diacylglyceryl transferase [Bacteroidota bacterium]MDA1344243.1 diacylglyceryl transferase [Bacteroidota bacterium]
MLERLKKKWGINSNLQLTIILIVFAITGSASVKLGALILEYFQFTADRFKDLPFPNFWYYSLRLVLIFPIYQILLIVVGTLFFQRKFFWEFEKKMLKKLFTYKRKK